MRGKEKGKIFTTDMQDLQESSSWP